MPEKTASDEAAVFVEFDAVSKWYGQVIALNKVSLRFLPGITGLLGPNGAGKTTMLDLIMGRIKPSQGVVRVFGCDPWKNSHAFERVGYCPDSEKCFEKMSAFTFVKTMGRLYGLGEAASRQKTWECLDLVGMTRDAYRAIATFSRGMRQRVKLAAALVNNPDLLILDEPLNGLDPIARFEIIALLRQLANKGVTIIVSSHILSEVESLTHRIVLIHCGNVLAEGEIQEIRGLIENQPLTYRIATPAPRAVARELIELECVLSIKVVDESSLVVRTSDAPRLCAYLQERVAEGAFSITELCPLDDSLEAVFQYLVKQ
jgi:ABC-2 type transport system ATP-binding protein